MKLFRLTLFTLLLASCAAGDPFTDDPIAKAETCTEGVFQCVAVNRYLLMSGDGRGASCFTWGEGESTCTFPCEWERDDLCLDLGRQCLPRQNGDGLYCSTY